MAILRCPKCNSVRVDDAPAGEGWKSCARCQHTWLHHEEGVQDTPLPGAAAEAPPVAPQPVEIASAPDYSPDSYHDRQGLSESQALTVRRQAEDTDRLRPHSEHVPVGEREQPLEDITGQAPVIASTPVPRDGSEPRPRNAESGSSKVELEVKTGGSQMAVDLFDSIEREIEQERSAYQTRRASVASSELTCPACNHRFMALPSEDSVTCPQCSSEVSTDERTDSVPDGADPLIGREIRGCKVDRKIGEGGMGAVYHARQLSLDRSVAIKVLPPELKRDKKFLHRFEQEAKSLARINHPNIMHVYDFGEEDRLGIYFMTMEFVDGLDLAEILRQRRRIPQLEVVDMMRQAALGLQQAASKGVVHRDIKPDNLMVTAEGVWKVSDFGLAKQNDAMTQVTRAGIRVGTPAFMSPEQCDGKPLDFRSDVYSLGVTAYTALTGRLPFDGESPFAIMLKHKTQIAPSLREILPEIAPEIADLVARMMAKDAAERAESWQSLIDELAAKLEELNPGARASMSGGHSALATPAENHRESGGSRPSDRLPIPGVLGDATESSAELPPLPDAMVDSDRNGILSAPERRSDPGAQPRQPARRRDPGRRQPPPGRRSSPPSPPNLSPASPSPTAVPLLGPGGMRPATPPPQRTTDDDLPDSAAVGSAVDALIGGLEPEPPPQSSPSPGRRPTPPSPAEPRAQRRGASSRRPPSSEPSGPRRTGSPRRAGADGAKGAARQRGHRHEWMEYESKGDEALSRGKIKQAHQAYLAALQRVSDASNKRSLMTKVEQTRKRMRAKRRRRLLLGIPVLLALVAGGWWYGMPRLHPIYADYRWNSIDTSDEASVRAFVERHRQWRSWYAQAFPTYELPALDRAERRLESIAEPKGEADSGAD